MKYKYRFWNQCLEKGVKEPEAAIGQLYINGMSCNAIKEWFEKNHEIECSVRNINHYVNDIGIMRDRSKARKAGINNGRIKYYIKPEVERYKAKQITAKIRFKVLSRDEFKCCLCGNGRHNDHTVEIHHIDGPESTMENLQTLCYMCHSGLHRTEKE